MLINHEEYRKMFEAEEKLWWYKILHEKVLKAIQKEGFSKEISILDAGCGTGGLMQFLKSKGFDNIQGFDFSPSAVAFTKSRGLKVQHASVDSLSALFQKDSFDVIICDDVFYALEETQIKAAFENISALLKPKGIFITNNNAFRAFYGIHDIAVGGKHRFVLADFKKYTFSTDLKIKYSTYWSFFLSPLILLVRQWQQFQIKRNGVDVAHISSDVSVPPKILNGFFYYFVKLEELILRKGFFGSSLFLTLKKSV